MQALSDAQLLKGGSHHLGSFIDESRVCDERAYKFTIALRAQQFVDGADVRLIFRREIILDKIRKANPV